ncbi:MAG TPA: hypothetical protein VGK96_22000 [Candidatus Sulfotelmatobacter sp.]
MSNRLTLLTSAAFIAAGISIPVDAQAQAQPAQPAQPAQANQSNQNNQNILDSLCDGLRLPCVTDQRRTNIGLSDSYEVLKRPINGKWYLIFNDTNGLQNNTMFFYANSTCTGQAYIAYKGELPPIAQFDGVTLWGPEANHAVVSISSWSIQGPPNPTAAGACASYGPNYSFQQEVAFPEKIDTTNHGWHPPFKVE